MFTQSFEPLYYSLVDFHRICWAADELVAHIPYLQRHQRRDPSKLRIQLQYNLHCIIILIESNSQITASHSTPLVFSFLLNLCPRHHHHHCCHPTCRHYALNDANRCISLLHVYKHSLSLWVLRWRALLCLLQAGFQQPTAKRWDFLFRRHSLYSRFVCLVYQPLYAAMDRRRCKICKLFQQIQHFHLGFVAKLYFSPAFLPSFASCSWFFAWAVSEVTVSWVRTMQKLYFCEWV